jgi:hypothetical protein
MISPLYVYLQTFRLTNSTLLPLPPARGRMHAGLCALCGDLLVGMAHCAFFGSAAAFHCLFYWLPCIHRS